MNNSVVPMAVDAVHTPLIDKKQSRLCIEGGCFYCHQKGHMANQCPVRASSRVPEGSAQHVQLSDRKVGYCPAQAGGSLASRGGGNGRVFSTRAQNSGMEATLGEGRSMVTTNPFWARLTAQQTYSSREDASVCQEKPEVSRKEVQRFIGKLR